MSHHRSAHHLALPRQCTWLASGHSLSAVKWCDAVWGSPATVCALPGRRPRGGGCLHWGNAHLATAAIFTLSSCFQPLKIVLAGGVSTHAAFYYFTPELFFLRGHYKSTFRAKKRENLKNRLETEFRKIINKIFHKGLNNRLRSNVIKHMALLVWLRVKLPPFT